MANPIHGDYGASSEHILYQSPHWHISKSNTSVSEIRSELNQQTEQLMYHDNSTVQFHESTPSIDIKSRKHLKIILGCCAFFTIVAVTIAVPGILTSRKKTSSSHNAITGTSGSVITMEDGSSFTYVNDFGGDWVYDPAAPFGPGGKAQSWSKRVGAEEWVWVTEPFICPALYEKYVNSTIVQVVDEWSLSIAMGDDLAKEMEDHYATFITEKDFADIAGAGLNWVRIPIGFWAIEVLNDEPFLEGVSWKYFLKAIQWARKYGLRVYLDLHSLPGSQNGWVQPLRKSMHGVMGIANAERTLTYLRILAEFVSQDQYRDVVPIIGIVNEILMDTVGQVPTQSYYYAAYEAIRSSIRSGADAGPYIAIHEGFKGDRLGMVSLLLGRVFFRGPIGWYWINIRVDVMSAKPCAWAIATNQSQKAFGVTIGGEFSTATNDCGLWLNGIGGPERPECRAWDDWNSYNATLIASFRQVTLATMDALQNFFFWTWKVGNSTILGTSSSPLWHYQLGLERGWIPKGTQLDLLPTYTATGTIKTLSGPTFPAAPTVFVGKGWSNDEDTALAYVPVNGCTYPDPWNAANAPLPTTSCTGT
ncbi:hypothetical protein H0H92_014751 [Tricholoma furcatifolium]|nr:hypothetical protein H0H92_014751 [Tricholoma furcatifolium]